MKKFLFVLGALLLVSKPVFAQATQNSFFAWNIQATDQATAQGYTYKHYDDNSTTGVAFTNVTCTSTGTANDFSCQAPIPAYTPGSHTITLTASDAAGNESGKSVPFAFTFVVVPSVPTNIRIVGK